MSEQSSTKQTAGIVYLLFVSFVIFGALISFSYVLFSGQSGLENTSITSIILLSALALVAAEMAVEFSPRMVITVLNLPIMLAIIFSGIGGACIVASVGTAWMARKWTGIAVLFNMSVGIIYSLASAVLFIYLRNLLHISIENINFGLLALFIITGLTMSFVNMSIVTVFVRVKYRQNLKKLWIHNFLPALPSQLVLLGIGLVILAIYIKAGLIGAALFFVPIFAGQHVFKLLQKQQGLLAEQTKLSQELMDMNIGLAGALIMLLDSKDHYTASHSAGVAMYCRDMASMMGMSDDQQRIAHMAGLLHDLGKVGTPDSVLKKKGKLTPEEWEQVKQHPTTAAEALSQLASHKEIADIIRHHQEHFDGGGYPYGKKGDEIPELSRMLAVADTYHALTSNRPYRKAKSPFEALIILRRVAGTQLDPKYVEVMAQVLKNEDLSYREGSKADFLKEFQKDRPARRLDAFRKRAKEV